MGRAKFSHSDFLAAALAIVAEHGPFSVTVASISERLGSPTGSFYHRFASRDLLLGALWFRRRRGQRSTGCVGAPACELGYQVLEAEDGLRALHTQDGLPRLDLLVTDVGLLNGMNGRQLAEAVRQLRPGLPVLFITG